MSRLFIRIKAGEAAIAVPEKDAIVSPEGVYLANIHLSEGTPVFLWISDGLSRISVHGSACKNWGEVGVIIRFDDLGREESRKLASMLGVAVAV